MGTGMRVDEIKPTFDVFSIGKVLWSMISGKSVLPLWYWNRDKFNLEKQFADDSTMPLINGLLARCVVEEESKCLPSFDELQSQIEEVIRKIEFKSSVLGKSIKRRCLVCGAGHYEMTCDRNTSGLHNLGLRPAGTRAYRIFDCNACSHVQMFACTMERIPTAWID